MDITPLISASKKIITSYGEGFFVVNEDRYDGNICVLADKVINWHEVNLSQFNVNDFDIIKQFSNEVEIVLLGCGKEHMPLTAEFRSYFKNNNIALEIMTTMAACRTYNVLLSEERKVAALLVAV